MSDVADAVFAALSAPAAERDPWRLQLYLARVAIDHGQRALAALRAGDEALFAVHLRAYGQIAKGLIGCGYWLPDAAEQVTAPPLQPVGGYPCA